MKAVPCLNLQEKNWFLALQLSFEMAYSRHIRANFIFTTPEVNA